jgi:transposase
MSEVNTIGLDLAKSVFQVRGVDASGKAVMRRQLRRRQVVPFFRKLPPCPVGLEASARAPTIGRARLQRWAMKYG